MAQPRQDPINLLNMWTEVGTRYVTMSIAVLVRTVLLQLHTLPQGTIRPSRAVFPCFREYGPETDEHQSLEPCNPNCILIAIGYANPTRPRRRKISHRYMCHPVRHRYVSLRTLARKPPPFVARKPTYLGTQAAPWRTSRCASHVSVLMACSSSTSAAPVRGPCTCRSPL